MKHLKTKAEINFIMINIDKWLERDIDTMIPINDSTNNLFYNNR